MKTLTFPYLSQTPFAGVCVYCADMDVIYIHCVAPAQMNLDHQEFYSPQIIADVNPMGEVQGLEILQASSLFKNPSSVTEIDIRALIYLIGVIEGMDREEALSSE